MNIKDIKGGARLTLIAAVISLVAMIGCIIYGAVYEQYSDYVVVLSLLVGAALFALYAIISKKFTSWFNFLGVIVTSFGLGLFITNSYNVWADCNGNLQQYGKLTGEFNFFNSQGGPYPAAILIILALAAAILGIISCFSERGTRE